MDVKIPIPDCPLLVLSAEEVRDLHSRGALMDWQLQRSEEENGLTLNGQQSMRVLVRLYDSMKAE